jgi:NIPSNAP
MTLPAGASLLTSAVGAPPKRQYFELQWFHLSNNGAQVQRANDFFGQVYVPAAQRLGMPPIGFFQPVIGEQAPFLLMLSTLASLDSLETANQRLAADPEYRKGFEAYLTGGLAYMRRDISLLKAFPEIPAITPPAGKPRSGSRIFEMRTYESNTSLTLARKIRMFETGEAAIFRRLGMSPVFFAQTIVGRNVPNLTYMLCYDDLAAREKLWKDFGADPEWQKLRSAPGNSDAEIVSNISNTILRPAPYSQIA